MLEEVHDQVELIVDLDDFLEFDYVGVLDLAERLDLSEVHTLIPILELFFHFLDGDYLVVLEVEGLEYGPETAVAQGLEDLVLLHNITDKEVP